MAKMTDYGRRRVNECTGAWLKGCVKWLEETQGGCCHIAYDVDAEREFCICVGWHDPAGDPEDGDWRNRLAWMIGTQSPHNAMQADLDLDFEMPYDPETGDVDDTLREIEVVNGHPAYMSWDRLAARIRKEARRVWRDWAKEGGDVERNSLSRRYDADLLQEVERHRTEVGGHGPRTHVRPPGKGGVRAHDPVRRKEEGSRKMTVRQLNRDQVAELKRRMIDDEIYEREGRCASYGELADAESIPDERVFERYAGTDFTAGDFFATA